MEIVTPDFIERVIRSGALAKAQNRAANGTASPRNQAQWDKFTTWSLICEEILDTERPADWYDDVLAELVRRGFDHEQINRLRRFAWRTVGWLNYDRMLWEWVCLDDNDIRRALDWQLEDGVISRQQHELDLASLRNPKLCAEAGSHESYLCHLADQLFEGMDHAESDDSKH